MFYIYKSLIILICFIIMFILGVSIGNANEKFYPRDHKHFMEQVSYRILFPCSQYINMNDFISEFSGVIFAMNDKNELIILNTKQTNELRFKQKCTLMLLTSED